MKPTKTILVFCDIDDTAVDFELSTEKKIYINGSNQPNDPEPLKGKIAHTSQLAQRFGYLFHLIFLTHKQHQ